MNFLPQPLLRLLFPSLARERREHKDELAWVAIERYNDFIREQDNARNKTALRQVLSNVCDQRDLILQTLMTLVAKDELGLWTTVFDADTQLPQEVADYLDSLVVQS